MYRSRSSTPCVRASRSRAIHRMRVFQQSSCRLILPVFDRCSAVADCRDPLGVVVVPTRSAVGSVESSIRAVDLRLKCNVGAPVLRPALRCSGGSLIRVPDWLCCTLLASIVASLFAHPGIPVPVASARVSDRLFHLSALLRLAFTRLPCRPAPRPAEPLDRPPRRSPTAFAPHRGPHRLKTPKWPGRPTLPRSG